MCVSTCATTLWREKKRGKGKEEAIRGDGYERITRGCYSAEGRCRVPAAPREMIRSAFEPPTDGSSHPRLILPEAERERERKGRFFERKPRQSKRALDRVLAFFFFFSFFFLSTLSPCSTVLSLRPSLVIPVARHCNCKISFAPPRNGFHGTVS